MFPAIASIDAEHIVENHCAQTQQDELSYIPNVEGRVKSVRFQAFPAQAFLIAEGGHLVAHDVAQESEFEPFMQRVRRYDHPVIALNQEHLAPFWMRVKL